MKRLILTLLAIFIAFWIIGVIGMAIESAMGW